MARKKKETMMETNGTPAVAEAVFPEATVAEAILAEPATATAVLETPAQPADNVLAALPVAAPVVINHPATTHSATNGQRRPVATWKFPAAGGVTIEVALWPNTITLSGGETVEVLNATVARSYKDAHGNWQKGGSFRVAEIPVLVHALLRAHGFALDGREMSCPI